MRLFNTSFIAHTRRNHALEHATIHLLNGRHPTAKLGGWSTPAGFYVYGHVPTADVQGAASEALYRLRRGERNLAVYPRCGTNLVTAGTLVGSIAFLTMLPGDNRSRRERLPLLILLSTLALLLAQYLGPAVQEYVTTDVNHSDSHIVKVERGTAGRTPVHRVLVSHGAHS